MEDKDGKIYWAYMNYKRMYSRESKWYWGLGKLSLKKKPTVDLKQNKYEYYSEAGDNIVCFIVEAKIDVARS